MAVQLLLEADGVRHACATAELAGARTPRLNHALDSVIMRLNSRFGWMPVLLVLGVGVGVSAPPPDWRILLQLGLEEGIVKKQLPEVNRLLKGEKLEVVLACRKEGPDTITPPPGVLPERVGKWLLVRIDMHDVERRSTERTYEYLRLCLFKDGTQPRLSLMVDMAVPPESDLIVIDHGILELWFVWRDGAWKIDKTEQLYA